MRHRFLVIPVAIVLTPAAGAAQSALDQRPSVTVTTFDYATVASQLGSDARARGHPSRHGVQDPTAFAAALGTGAADLVVEKLIETHRIRVLERRQLAVVRGEQALASESSDGIARARYVVAGSVTRLGFNDKELGGAGTARAAAAIFGRLLAFSARTSVTTVHLTARVVDTRTGEIIGSFTAEGKSNRRWSAVMFGVGAGGIHGGTIADRNVRETAIGEATTRAAAAIADHVIALRATRLR